jgi:Holliday junction resolvase-like predicted endonuclease
MCGSWWLHLDGQTGERKAKRWLEDRGYTVHDANILFAANCPNIDLVVYGQHKAVYVQVKSSSKPAGKGCVVVDGSPWTDQQLYGEAPIYNKQDGFCASLVIIVHSATEGETEFFAVPPERLEQLLRPLALAWADKHTRDGRKRSIKFRKELPHDVLLPWLNNIEIGSISR